MRLEAEGAGKLDFDVGNEVDLCCEKLCCLMGVEKEEEEVEVVTRLDVYLLVDATLVDAYLLVDVVVAAVAQWGH